jgi:4-alpha-glucanotransferase
VYDRRTSGILLHPTSLPGPGGIGDLGDAAYRFVDWLVEAKQRRWQIMPLGPTGYGDSPYASLSALAGNPMLISLDRLVDAGIVRDGVLERPPAFPAERIDFGDVIPWKTRMLRAAFADFTANASAEQHADFAAFRELHEGWLANYALFAAVKAAHDGAPWNQWDRAIARREDAAVDRWRTEQAEQIRFQEWLQWLFFKQWQQVREYANARDIKIIGDIPIFVAFDSADVWANTDLFFLDEAGDPTVIAGVPPDYFSPTGQRWGNPLYRWDVLADRGYDWWIERFRMMLTLVDIIRIDHFRGFAAYWEVPAAEETAINGQWVPGPGAALFEAVRSALGTLPIIAEDLGLITPDVEALRVQLGFPGMAVLQFAWGGDAANIYLPHNHAHDQLIYTGTHDNDTTVGWWQAADDDIRDHVRVYLNTSGEDIAWDFIRTILASIADTAIIPMQDVLSLGTEARMNLPGQALGNWNWRMRKDQLDSTVAQRLATLTSFYGREPLDVEAHRDMI